MAVGSDINPNFPLPGIDQSSRGFRDNFSTIKQEIENIQSKQIQLTGDCVSDPILIDSGSGIITVNTQVLFHSLTVSGNQHGMLFNNSGIITSSDVYYDSANVRVGINNSSPRAPLDVKDGIVMIGNANVLSLSSTSAEATILTNNSNNLKLGTNNVPVIYIDPLGRVGIGHQPVRKLDVISNEYDVALFTSTLDNTDVVVRLTTAKLNSSVGWAVENENTFAGGIRADVNGYISLHAGELPGSGLQNGSRALVINPANQFVGIGTASPTCRLDVNGNLSVSGSLTIGGSAPTLLGSRGGNAALTNLITLLAGMGIIVDGTTA